MAPRFELYNADNVMLEKLVPCVIAILPVRSCTYDKIYYVKLLLSI